MTASETIRGNVWAALEAMAAACQRSRRPPASVRMMAAVKTVPPEDIRAAVAAGVRLLGDNRIQEREAKQGALADLDAEWHFIGGLQSNKAAKAVALFDSVDSVESLPMAQRLSRLAAAAGKQLAVMIEINIAGEPQKPGVAPEGAEPLAAAVAALPGLRLAGLMTVPPAAPRPEAARRWFAALRELGQRLRGYAAGPWELSMGMSEDFTVAIEEGATIVRLGRGLFGARPSRA